MNSEQKRQLIEDFKSGMENKHLVEKYEVSFSTVFKPISKEKSIDERRDYKQLTLEEKKQLIKDDENGMSKKHLEKKYEVHQSTVSRLILNKESIHQKIKNLNSAGGNMKIRRLTSTLDSQFERALLS